MKELIQEAISIQRDLAILFSKLLLCFKHFLATSYGISEEYYRGLEDPLYETGQGNVLSGAGC